MSNHGRPPTLLEGQQGDHSTSFSLIRQGVQQTFHSSFDGGATYRNSGVQTLTTVNAMPGHEAPRIAELPPEMALQHNQAFQHAQQSVQQLPNHRYPTSSAVTRANTTINAIVAFENVNPFAAVYEGTTGNGEGHAMQTLHRLEAIAQLGPLTATQRNQGQRSVQRLFDAENTSNALELEAEAVHDDQHMFLPAVMRPLGAPDVAQARQDVALRHQLWVFARFPHASGGLGGPSIQTQIVNAMQDPLGRGDDDYKGD